MNKRESEHIIPLWTKLITPRPIIPALVACIILIGYIGILVGFNYFSQVRLRESALVQLRQDMKKRADAVTYFFSERKDDLKDLAVNRAICAFFENKDLGMSMQYGLRASLLAISNCFNNFLKDRKLDEDRIYDRIVLLNARGKLLAGSDSKKRDQENTYERKNFLTPSSKESSIILIQKRESIRIGVSLPYFFKSRYEGQIIAWIHPQTIYDLVKEGNKFSKRLIYITCGKHILPLPAYVHHKISHANLAKFTNINLNKIHRFRIIKRDGKKQDIIALRVPIKDTPLSLVNILPTSEVFNLMASYYLPLGMGVLAIIILGGVIGLLRINAQKLILYGRLEEASMIEHEIRAKNRQLEGEITIRKQVERELKKAREELETRVEERTIELARANQTLLREIEERKRVNRAMRRGEEKFKIVVEESPYGVSLLGKNGRYKYVNPRFVEIFGYTLEDIPTGRTWFKKAYPDEKYRRQVVSIWVNNVKFRKREDSWHHILHVKCKNGSEKIIDFKIVTMKTGDHLIFYEDITKQQRLESQLQQTQKMESIGTLAGGIAHDFNNILSAIIGYAEIAKLESSNNSKMKEYLDEILGASNRAKDLVGQILAFSRQTEERRGPVQLSSIVKEVLKLLRASLPSTIEIRQQIDEETGLIEANSTKIHQVLMNLCTNAYHAMYEKGGVLKVTLENVYINTSVDEHHPDLNTGPYVMLTVSDTGHGIPCEIMQRIFDPYFTTKNKEEGTGLGLSVVHGIVKAHGGAITVYSKPGKGSTFHVYFPRIIRKVTMISDKSTKPVPTGNEHILLVDDEVVLVGIGKRMLERLGYRVTTRVNSIEALELFRSNPDRFDMVITDMTMPNMTGEGLAKELIKIRADIPIVLCSGFSETITPERAKAIGVRAFVMKPFVIHNMATIIRNVLDANNEL